MPVEIRTIRKSDDCRLAEIIRATLTEFGANKKGTVYYDESTDHLSNLFSNPDSIYYVEVVDGEIAGGAGIYPSKGLPEDTCELVKMYLLPGARGKGLGKALIHSCCQFAADKGYKKVYLETMPELNKAVPLYEKLGFAYLSEPMGNTGHFGCNIWMIRDVHPDSCSPDGSPQDPASHI